MLNVMRHGSGEDSGADRVSQFSTGFSYNRCNIYTWWGEIQRSKREIWEKGRLSHTRLHFTIPHTNSLIHELGNAQFSFVFSLDVA